MAEPNEYDRQREERIRRNKAMLAKLQVKESVDKVAAPLLAAQRKKAEAKEAIRQKYVVSGPARQSQRAGAQRTRAKLQEQAQDIDADSNDEQSGLLGSQNSDEDSQHEPDSQNRSRKRKRSMQEADFDPAELAQQSSSDDDEEEESSSPDPDADQPGEGSDEEDLELQQALAMSLEGQSKTVKASTERSRSAKAHLERKPTQISSKAAQASCEPSDKVPKKRKAKTSKATTKARKAKAASRVGLVNPTVDEMRTAFSLFNPQNKNVITTENICRVAEDQGYNFDADEMKAMMEVAAIITQRASTTSMTFQGFQKLVEHYSTVT